MARDQCVKFQKSQSFLECAEFYVHHFGINDKLLEEIKDLFHKKWEDGEKEEFIDDFFDTKDFKLVSKNLWLRRRCFKNSVNKDGWSIKTTNIENGYLKIKEYNDEAQITRVLADYLNFKLDETCLENDVYSILNKYSISLVEIFPTTRIILKETETFKFYIDCSGEGYSNTWFLIGGIQAHSISEISKFLEFQNKLFQLSVMSKFLQIISWIDQHLFDNLVKIKAVPQNLYSDSHIRSDSNPIFELPV